MVSMRNGHDIGLFGRNLCISRPVYPRFLDFRWVFILPVLFQRYCKGRNSETGVM